MATATPTDLLDRWTDTLDPPGRERHARALVALGDRALHVVLRRWTDRALALRSSGVVSNDGTGQAELWSLAFRLSPTSAPALLRWSRATASDRVPLSDRVVLFRTRALALLLGLPDDCRPTDDQVVPIFRHYLVDPPPRSRIDGHSTMRYEPALRSDLLRLLSRAPSVAARLSAVVRASVLDPYASVRTEAVHLAVATANALGAEAWAALLPVLRVLGRDGPGDDADVYRTLVREPAIAVDADLTRWLAEAALAHPELRASVVDLFPAPLVLSLLRGVWTPLPGEGYRDLLARAAHRGDIRLSTDEISTLLAHSDAAVREAGMLLAAGADSTITVSRHRQIGRTHGVATLSLR